MSISFEILLSLLSLASIASLHIPCVVLVGISAHVLCLFVSRHKLRDPEWLHCLATFLIYALNSAVT